MRFGHYLLIISIFLWLLPLVIFGFWIAGSLQRYHDFVRLRELPVLGHAVNADLYRASEKYLRSGEGLLRDGIVRDWILNGEQDFESLQGFMQEIQHQYGMCDIGIVSDFSETYYGADGWITRLSPNNWERDSWYYLYRDTVPDTNLDAWYNHETGVFYIWINVPIFDNYGHFIGVAGGGVNSYSFADTMHSFSLGSGLNIYLARRDGALIYTTVAGLLKGERTRIHAIWNEDIPEILRRRQDESAGFILEPSGSRGSVLWARYSPEWDSFLIVERSAESVAGYRLGNLAFLIRTGVTFFIILIVVLLLMQRMVGRKFLTIENELEAVKQKTDALNRAHINLQERACRILEETSSSFGSRIGSVASDLILERSREIRSANNALSGFWIQAGKPVLEDEVDLADLCKQLLPRFTPDAMQKGQSLHVNFPKSGLHVQTDPNLFGIVLMEILSGAISHSASGAQILLHGYRIRESAVIDLIFPASVLCSSPGCEALLSEFTRALSIQLSYCSSSGTGLVLRMEFKG